MLRTHVYVTLSLSDYLFLSLVMFLPPLAPHSLWLNSGNFSKNLLLVYNMQPFLRHTFFRSKLCVLYAKFYARMEQTVWIAKQTNGSTTSHINRCRKCASNADTKLVYQWRESVAEYHLILNTHTHIYIKQISNSINKLTAITKHFKWKSLGCAVSCWK